MRVGLVVYGSLATISGGNLYDQKLVEALRRASHEVEVLSLPAPGGYLAALAQNLSTRHFRAHAEGSFDVLLQDELVHPSLVRANRRGRGSAAQREQPPRVGIVHHLRSWEERPRWQNRLYGWVEKAYLETLDAFLYNSPSTREGVEGVLGEPRPCVVARPGKDRLVALAPTPPGAPPRAEDGLRLLFVGNLIPRKGLHTLVEALLLLRRETWSLDVVGDLDRDPAYSLRVRRRVSESGLEPRITFHGCVPDALLAQRFAAGHVLTVPSSYEGFGIVYLEGMGFGLPAVATTSGAASELIRDGENGLLVPPSNTPALARALRRLWDDPELLARLRRGARATYESHATWDETMARAVGFLEDLAASWSCPRR